jgi:hypothetical protein
MKHSRNLVGAYLSVALLAACGGGSVPSSSAPTLIGPVQTPHKKDSQKFKYTGKEQSFMVPTGVTEVTVVAKGASGGGAASGSYEAAPGLGGSLKAIIPVTPGELLIIYVGGEGGHGYGGFNGGGAPGNSEGYSGSGGGGASDVRQGGTTLSNRVFVAGGGGGKGSGVPYSSYSGGAGGSGGGKTGGPGETGGGYPPGYGGGGGSQSSGGSGGRGGVGEGSMGCNGQQGYMGSRGAGGDGGINGCGFPGGGGGGGYYGGGGGGGSAFFGCTNTGCNVGSNGGGGGGGGGSSFVEKSATHVTNLQGEAPEGNGKIVISW